MKHCSGYINADQLAKRIGITKMTVSNWCRSGYVRAYRPNEQREWEIPTLEVERLLQKGKTTINGLFPAYKLGPKGNTFRFIQEGECWEALKKVQDHLEKEVAPSWDMFCFYLFALGTIKEYEKPKDLPEDSLMRNIHPLGGKKYFVDLWKDCIGIVSCGYADHEGKLEPYWDWEWLGQPKNASKVKKLRSKVAKKGS